MIERLVMAAACLLIGAYGLLLALSIYLGYWFEPVDYEETDGWERSAT